LSHKKNFQPHCNNFPPSPIAGSIHADKSFRVFQFLFACSSIACIPGASATDSFGKSTANDLDSRVRVGHLFQLFASRESAQYWAIPHAHKQQTIRTHQQFTASSSQPAVRMEDIAMKTAQGLAVATLALASIPLLAQQVNTNAQSSGSANATVAGSQASGSASTNSSGNIGRGEASGSATGTASASGLHGTNASTDDSANAATNRYVTSASGSASGSEEMRPVNGELQGKLDAKTAKPGDQVVVKTTEKTTTADGTEIPKGSRLVGRVTQVQAHEKGQADSQMGIAFDHAELKGGRSIPIHSAILSVNPPASAMTASSMGGGDSIGDGMGGGSMGMGGGGRAMAGGGALGGGGRVSGGGSGLVGGTVSSVSSAGGHVGSDVGSTTGGALGATGHAAGDATGAVSGVGGNVSGTASGASSLAAHTTGVPGVMLRGDATGSASGMLSATNKNVHLDSGTQIVLGIAAAGR
jgi:hypothetical protein